MPSSVSIRWPGMVAAALLTGCTVGPNWSAPRAWSPSHWFEAARPPPAVAVATPSVLAPDPIDPAWWNLFHDAELTSLESRVAAANLSVRLAATRLTESRSQLQITSTGLYPTVKADGSYTRERISQRGVAGLFGGGSGQSFGSGGSLAGGTGGRSGAFPTAAATGGRGIAPFDLFQYGFDASWEIDLWGHVRRQIESADASVDASAEARRGALLSVVAEVARDYLQLRGVQARLAIAQENIGTAQQSLQLSQERFRGGLTTELDVANASAQLSDTEAQVPGLEAQQAQTINALSLMLGEAPGALDGELQASAMVPPVPPLVPVGVPSELARRRPDIRQAEAQLHAATADIGVAVAEFYPSVTLDGSFGFQALQFKQLPHWSARQYGAGPTINLPIFHGGQLKATLELRKVEQQEAALNYQQTVLQAWHDVDNAMTAYRTEQQRREALAHSVAANRRALSLARQRYTQGVADFLSVLDAERQLLQAQLQLADSTTTVSQNMVQLYKALGGGWQVDFPDEARKS